MTALVIHSSPLAALPAVAMTRSTPPIGSTPTPYDGAPERFIAEGEGNGRFFRLEVRPGFKEGQYLGLALKAWGAGHWTIAEGQPHFYSKRDDALLAGQRWIETGRR